MVPFKLKAASGKWSSSPSIIMLNPLIVSLISTKTPGIPVNCSAEQFTGIPGVLVDIKDTIKGFNMIMDGELDHLPESAFNLKGTIEEAIEAGEKMLAEAKES